MGTALTQFGFAPARGRLMVALVEDNLESVSSYYVPGAVTSMGAFKPPQAKSQTDAFPDRHLLYYAGGSRLYLQVSRSLV